MNKEVLTNGKTKYTGKLLDMSYDIDFNTDEEFESWLKQKMTRYTMNEIETRVFRAMLGIDLLEARIMKLEGLTK